MTTAKKSSAPRAQENLAALAVRVTRLEQQRAGDAQMINCLCETLTAVGAAFFEYTKAPGLLPPEVYIAIERVQRLVARQSAN